MSAVINTTTTKKPRQKKQKKKTAKTQKVEVGITVAQAPVAKTKVMRTTSPKISQTSPNSTRIKHREFITSVSASGTAGAFQCVTYSINPGLGNVFTWLSGVARNWEKYKFHSLKFLYIPRCSTALPGSIMIALDYDSADAAPISDQVIMSYDSCQDSPVWKECSFSCPKDKLAEGPLRRFVRHAVLGSNLDIKTYDVGTLMVSSSDSTASAALGRMFVEYDVEFYIPQVPPEGPEFVAGVNASSGGTLNGNMPLGTVPVTVANSVSNVISNGTNNFIGNLGSGAYNLTQSVVGTGLAALGAPSISSGQGTVQVMNSPVTNSAGTSAFGQWLVSGVGPNTVLQLGTLAATTVTSANLRMNKVFSDIMMP